MHASQASTPRITHPPPAQNAHETPDTSRASALLPPRYADVLSRFRSDEKEAVTSALSLIRGNRATPVSAPVFRAESDHQVRNVYIRGFDWNRISVIKRAMGTLKFYMSQVVNVSWLGHYILEVVVMEGYEAKFIHQINAIPGLSAVPDFKVLGRTDDDQSEAKRRFTHRAQGIINSTNREVVKHLFQDWMDEVNAGGQLSSAPLPTMRGPPITPPGSQDTLHVTTPPLLPLPSTTGHCESVASPCSPSKGAQDDSSLDSDVPPAAEKVPNIWYGDVDATTTTATEDDEDSETFADQCFEGIANGIDDIMEEEEETMETMTNNNKRKMTDSSSNNSNSREGDSLEY